MEHGQGAPIRCIVLEIGKLSAILPDSIRFCFDLCCEGTLAEGAELHIIETPGQARCPLCGKTSIMAQLFDQCACGNGDLEWLAGHELKIKTVEFA